MSESFKASHIFVLEDGTEVPVQVESRGDPVARDEAGHPWMTNMGVMDVWWVCQERGVTRLREVKMPPGVLHPEIALLVEESGAKATHKVFGGNPVAGYPYYYGWIIRFERPTTSTERDILRARGFVFSGFKWCRKDT